MSNTVKYYSTKDNNISATLGEAILNGQAPNKGLYMPDKIPVLGKDLISKMRDMTYDEISYHVTRNFTSGEIPDYELREITREAYNFKVPIQRVSDDVYLLRMGEGPTASFKDFAAVWMSRAMDYVLEAKNQRCVLFVATSGDTGSAIAKAYHGRKNTDVVVFFPREEVTDRQRKLMTTLGGNIFPFAVNGKFDDCQKMAKNVLDDLDLKYLNPSSANSINVGRLIPQSVYYFYSYSRLPKCDSINFAIPTGNAGNWTGGEIAKAMGCPIKKFIIGTNSNDEIPNFIEKGSYTPIIPSRNCLSNAMNVGHPSNLARIIDLYGGMMDENGVIYKMPNMDAIRKQIFSRSISDELTINTISDFWNEHSSMIEPHGAVGYAASQKYLEQSKDKTPLVCLETAHCGKFPNEIISSIGVGPELPQSMIGIDAKKEKYEVINPDYEELKQLLKKLF